MSEIFGAALMGGGSGPAYAAISVTYPAGATCTCALGSKTFTAPDTSGQALFIVPTAGQWVVTISRSGQEPVSQTINVTENKVYSVTMAFTHYLYAHGDTCDDITGGYIYKTDRQGTSSDSGAGTLESTRAYLKSTGISGVRKDFLFTNNKIDLRSYNTLVVKGNLVRAMSAPPYSAGLMFGIYENTDPTEDGISKIQHYEPLGEFEERVDISEVSEGYLALSSYIYVRPGAQGTGEGYYYEVWLE